MIEESQIVQDTRQIRCLISKQFDDDLDRYIDFLQTHKSVSLEKEKNINEPSIQKENAQQKH